MGKNAIHEINDPIAFKYRCNGDPSTANPTVDILDEEDGVDHTLVVGVDPDPAVNLIQKGTSRIFKGVFTPDAVGVWSIHGTDENGGDLVKDYAIGPIGVQTMGAAIVTVDAKVDEVNAKVDNIAADAGGAHFG